jgi:hypothetical protein
MARIAIEIDTEQQARTLFSGGSRFTSPKQLGILSSISLYSGFVSAIEAGYNATHHKHLDAIGYNSGNLQSNFSDLKNKYNCDFVAAVGGLIVHSAIYSLNVLPFVSLVGAMPSNVGQYCRGGVSLESWASNPDRIAIALAKLAPLVAGITAANIGLYRNSASSMASDEANNWTGYTPVINSTANGYAMDFNGGPHTASIIPASIQGIVISADPTFQSDKNSLVAAVNTWLSAPGTNRYVVYPSQIYIEASPNQPLSTKSTLYGPDLYQAFYKLGQLAQNSSNNNNAYVGFDRAPNLTLHL